MKRSVATLVVGLVLGSAAVAHAGRQADTWTTLYPVHQPVSLGLPDSWMNDPGTGRASFFSKSLDGSANVELDVSAYPGSFAALTSALYTSARQTYLAQDPKARIRSRAVALPGGRAFEVITTLVRRSGSRWYPLSVKSYSFMRGGKVYQFVYMTLTPRIGTYFPVFERSARSIRFR
jgi:hypothetical protein